MKDTERLMDDAPPLMVRVRAPATLPAGYTFEGLLNDDPERPFICEVVSWHHRIFLNLWDDLDLIFALSLFLARRRCD